MIQTDKGHCWLTFENGYKISIFNGLGSYSENHFKQELINIPKFVSVDSKYCEIAVIYEGIFCTNKFIETNDSIKGWVTADELADVIYKVKNFIEQQNRRYVKR